MNQIDDLINLANQLPDAAIEQPEPPRTIKVYQHVDKATGKLLPVKRRVSKQEERGGLSARQYRKMIKAYKRGEEV